MSNLNINYYKMKKKIFNGFLVAVMLLAGMSTFVSCKDYDEDSYNELKTRLNSETTLREALQKQLEELAAYVKTIKSCECDLQKALADYLTKTDAAKTYETIEAHKASIQLLQDAIDKINATLGDVDTSKGTVAEQLTNMNILILEVKNIAEQAMKIAEEGKCKCDLTPLKEGIARLDGLVAGLTEDLKQVNDSALKALAQVYALEAQVAANRYSIDSLANVVKNLTPSTPTDLRNYATKAELAAAKLEALEKAQEAKNLAQQAMNKASEALGVANTAKSTAEAAKAAADAAKAKAEAAQAAADAAKEAAEAAKTAANAAKTEAEAAKLEAAAAKAEAEAAKAEAEAAKAAADAAKAEAEAAKAAADAAKSEAEAAKDSAAANALKIKDLETAVANCVTKTELADALKNLKDEITKLINDTIKPITEKLNKLQDDVLKRMITGVIVQGTNNAIFGSISMPLDARSTMLATYWGEYTKAVDFPYAANEDQYYYSDQYTAFSSSPVIYLDKNVTIGSGKHLLGEENGVASLGKLYLTINPAEVDFEGNQPLEGLFTSGTETQAPVIIDALQHSNTDLNFGLTRGANNGFYETDVRLNVANIDKARLQMDLKSLASDLKTVLKDRNKTSVIQFGATVYNNIQNVLPAYGAKVAWTDSATQQKHTLYSQYNLGIVTVKPVSFNFVDGISDKIAPNGKLRGYDRLQNFVGRISKEVKDKIHEMYPEIHREKLVFKFESITIGQGINPATGKSFDIQSDADGKIKVKVTGTVSVSGSSSSTTVTTEPQIIEGNPYTFTVNIPATDIIGTGTVNASADITEWVNELVKSINSRYGAGSDVDKAFGELVTVLDQIIKLETDLTDMVTDYENRVHNYISRVNNKLVNYIDYLDRSLQLCVVGSVDNKMALLSQSVYNPTKVSGSSMTLFPTTYSLELFAPAYKKFVAVTNVFDASTGAQAANYESLAKAANGNLMAEVFEGRKKCTINGTSGYIYEVAFAALDFHGKICVKKFYVQF